MDEIDIASEREYIARTSAISAASKDIDPGEPGECEYCGEMKSRLILGACARCRDKFNLP